MDTPPPPNSAFNLSDEESRKKYIRTFAGDMEIVKRGGEPDLTPLEPTPEEPTSPLPEEPVPPAPAAPLPSPESLPPPPITPTGPLVEAAPLLPPDPPSSPIQFQDSTPVRAPEIKGSPLETYAGDFLDKVKDTRASTATVLAAEEDAKITEEAPKKSGWGIVSIIAGVVLLLAGGTGVYVGYTSYLAKTQPVVLAPTVSAPIFVDEQRQIIGETPAAILDAIFQSMNQPPAPNSVRLLYTNISTTTGNDIFSALQFSAPAVLLRNIVALESMAGIVNIGGTVSPFFILSVTSYTDTFAGMLSWESTMPSDLSSLFPPYTPTAPTVSTTTPLAATTTATTTKKVATKKAPAKTATSTVATSTPPTLALGFRDEVVDNHDVRVYRDAQGSSVLMYGYWDKTTLVIARDPSSFTEILRRLATSHTQ